jgi:catechol-2,3-dioxygenase
MPDPRAAPPITGILESSLYVESLERSREFYQSLFGFEQLFADARLCALGVARRQVLLLFAKGASDQPNIVPGGVIPPHGGDGSIHLAFAIPAESLAAWEHRLAGHGIAVAGRVSAPRGGTSLYIRDPDGHLVELATPGLWTIY